ncbi:hypothetical protein [Oceanospirillum sanctuarii]|uniref:hypothetical protein n=1 Tax=Oceanospirillum sanctuarii TaxID=1434821 RepID=UPI000A35F599|nr:hypothetical protein [Oceanospirillum sanctuarii]
MVERIFYRDADLLEPLFQEAYGSCEFSRAAALQNIDTPFNPIQTTFALKEGAQYIGFINIWLDNDWYEIDEYPMFYITARLNCIFITEKYRSLNALKKFAEDAAELLVEDYLFPMEWYRCSPDPVFDDDVEVPESGRSMVLSFDAEIHDEEHLVVFNAFRNSLTHSIYLMCHKSPVFYFEHQSIYAEDNVNCHFSY